MAYIALDHVEKLYHVGEVTITAVSLWWWWAPPGRAKPPC